MSHRHGRGRRDESDTGAAIAWAIVVAALVAVWFLIDAIKRRLHAR